MHVSFPKNYAVMGINFKTVSELKFSPQLTETHRLKGFFFFFCNSNKKKSLETEILQENSLFGFNLK